MTITSDNLTAHELVGLHVRVGASADPTVKGLAGTVRDESRNMIEVEVDGHLVSVPKDKSSFSFELPGGQWVKVEGSRLRYRPEDRVKRGMAKW